MGQTPVANDGGHEVAFIHTSILTVSRCYIIYLSALHNLHLLISTPKKNKQIAQITSLNFRLQKINSHNFHKMKILEPLNYGG